jgi:hypothetical protein
VGCDLRDLEAEGIRGVTVGVGGGELEVPLTGMGSPHNEAVNLSRRYDLARDLVLGFAGHTVMTSPHVVELTHGACGHDGLLGLDAVGRHALVLGRETVAFARSP